MSHISSITDLKKLKLTVFPTEDEIISLKIKLPIILDYLYVLNNTFTNEDIEKKNEDLTFKYDLTEVENGAIMIETEDNGCFSIICAFLNTHEIDFKLQELHFSQIVSSDSMNTPTGSYKGLSRTPINKFDVVYGSEPLENVTSEVFIENMQGWYSTYSNDENSSIENYNEIVSKNEDVDMLDINEDFLEEVVYIQKDLIGWYKTITFENLEEELTIEASIF